MNGRLTATRSFCDLNNVPKEVLINVNPRPAI